MKAVHKTLKKTRKYVLEETSALAAVANTRKLTLTEAVVIKERKPALESQVEGNKKLFKLVFKRGFD